ncbi:MAG: TetR/AcrR family transcriptional regulator [Lachnotalea sp.]
MIKDNNSKADHTKKLIIEQTILLMKETDGNIELLTIRSIAARAHVGVGLINHYFESKKKLIEICVQTMIGGVVHSFKLEKSDGMKPIDMTKHVAMQVADFLMENKQISKVSILGDMKNPKEKDNSIDTALGFAYCMSGGQNPKKYMKKAFYLLSILQEAFLRKDVLVQNIGVDFYDKKQRDCYIEEIIDIIIGGEVCNT